MKNHIKSILESAGRISKLDNRSAIAKGINTCIENGMVEIKVSEKNMVLRNPSYLDENGNKKQFTLSISGFGRISRFYIKDSNMSERVIIEKLGQFLHSDLVKKEVGVRLNSVCECDRCNGKGIIPQFHYFCSGICFDCYGSGYKVKKVSI